MTAREYLLSIQRLDALIDSHIIELNRLREQAVCLRSPGFDEHTGGSHSSQAPFAQGIEAVIEMEGQISGEIARLMEARSEARKRVAMLKDSRERLCLMCRYFNGQSWDQVMATLGVSERTAFRIHDQALRHLTVPRKWQ